VEFGAPKPIRENGPRLITEHTKLTKGTKKTRILFDGLRRRQRETVDTWLVAFVSLVFFVILSAKAPKAPMAWGTSCRRIVASSFPREAQSCRA
jgi:hypothetical protein